MADKVIPNYRIKRILEIDEHVPRMNKKAITTLAKSLKIFLQEYAKDIHRHIVNTGSSYPVKPKHVGEYTSPVFTVMPSQSYISDINVSFDPRFIKYEFLTHARKIIEAQEDQMEPINKIMRVETINKYEYSKEEDILEEESRENMEISNNCRVNEQRNLNTKENLNGTKVNLKRTSKKEQKGGDKRRKQSILSYFTPK